MAPGRGYSTRQRRACRCVSGPQPHSQTAPRQSDLLPLRVPICKYRHMQLYVFGPTTIPEPPMTIAAQIAAKRPAARLSTTHASAGKSPSTGRRPPGAGVVHFPRETYARCKKLRTALQSPSGTRRAECGAPQIHGDHFRSSPLILECAAPVGRRGCLGQSIGALAGSVRGAGVFPAGVGEMNDTGRGRRATANSGGVGPVSPRLGARGPEGVRCDARARAEFGPTKSPAPTPGVWDSRSPF
jgi:hypothetical protein